MHIGGRILREQAAVYDRARPLRQRVFGVPGLQFRGHARCAHERVVVRRRCQPLGCLRIRRNHGNRRHVASSLVTLDPGHLLKIGSGSLV